MTFQPPRNIPSTYTSAQQPYEETYWRPAHRGPGAGSNGRAESIGGKINDFFSDGKDLPMYKDKPSYAVSRRRGFFQRKRSYIITAVIVLGLLYWLRSGDESQVPTYGGGLKDKGKDLWNWVEKASPKKPKAADWESRRQSVKDAFLISWNGYEKYAWGQDEYYPVSKKGRDMVEGGIGWIVVDALDTAMIMNLTTCVKHARDWISTSLHYTANHEVNTFETTIRMLGGLLSAHYLSTKYPDLAPLTEDDINQPGEDLYIEKATDLADRIVGAFDSQSGIPYASFNLNTSAGIPSHADGGASSTAEAATTQLEFKYLAKLTGETHYWEKVERVMEVIDAQKMPGGLLPIYIYPTTGNFRGENIRLGSRGDSYYEYLIKQYLQTSKEEPVYLEMWDESLAGVKEHLLTYSKHAHLTILAERPNGLKKDLSPKMDHLVCFMPGTIALAVTGGRTVAQAKASGSWTAADTENMDLAQELMKTCWSMYLATTTGLAPEITYYVTDSTPKMYKDYTSKNRPVSKPLDEAGDSGWRGDINIHMNDEHNLQRPETVESLFYMWRITGDEIYREWGWEMFKSFVKHTVYPPPRTSKDDEPPSIYAFTSLDSANKPVSDGPQPHRDNMESFWLAETLKYFYLLFSPNDLLPLDEIVINTEAHIFPRFEMGKNFKTGWKRGALRDFSEIDSHDHGGEKPISDATTTKVVRVEKGEEIQIKSDDGAATKEAAAKQPVDQTAAVPISDGVDPVAAAAVRAEAMKQVTGQRDKEHKLVNIPGSEAGKGGEQGPLAKGIKEEDDNDHDDEAIRIEALRQAVRGASGQT